MSKSCSGRLTKEKCPNCPGHFAGDSYGPIYSTCVCKTKTIEQRAEEWALMNPNGIILLETKSSTEDDAFKKNPIVLRRLGSVEAMKKIGWTAQKLTKEIELEQRAAVWLENMASSPDLWQEPLEKLWQDFKAKVLGGEK